MQPELYTRVMLTQDVPEAALKAGDTAMYIDYLPVELYITHKSERGKIGV